MFNSKIGESLGSWNTLIKLQEVSVHTNLILNWRHNSRGQAGRSAGRTGRRQDRAEAGQVADLEKNNVWTHDKTSQT